MKLSDIALDVEGLENGTWVENLHEVFPKIHKEFAVKTRGIGNRSWRKRNSQLLEAVGRQKKPNGSDMDQQHDMMTILLAETGLMDWRGLENDSGQPIPFSADEARKILSDPSYRMVRDACIYAADVVANRLVSEREEDVKN